MKSIATLGSHCALQVLKGAKDEGFKTVIISERRRERFYRRFRFIDNFLVLDDFKDVIQAKNLQILNDLESVFIPHGTLISQVGVDVVEHHLSIPIFGNRWMLRWEADRGLKERLMRRADLKVPETYSTPDDISSLCIAKLQGAEGGRGYFLASDPVSFRNKLNLYKSLGLIKEGEESQVFIQQYILGVPVYLQYFYSPLDKNIELLGVDRRYETTVDALGRVKAEAQLSSNLIETYRIVGNIPLVLRESLLDNVYSMGEQFVEASQDLVPPGIIGPFCLEGVYDAQGDFICFEFSARIVAGTNLYVEGSPYTPYLYNRPMSMGRRIALELKDAIETGQESLLLT